MVALERERLFSQIRSIAEKLEIVSRTTNDGIWDWDLTKNKIEWNIRAHKILGKATAELISTPDLFLELIHPDDRHAVRTALEPPYLKDHPIQQEFQMYGSGEQFIWIHLAGDIVWDAAGNAIRMIGSLNDITEKKKDEARIIQLAYHDALTGLPNRL